MPDLNDGWESDSRRHLLASLERLQQDALGTLQRAGVSTARYQAAAETIVAYCVQTLRLFDEAYSQVAAYVSQPGRSQHHEQWLNEQAGFLLRSLQQGIAALVASAIDEVKQGAKTPPPHKEVIKEVIVPQPSPGWQEFFQGKETLLIGLALVVWGLLCWLFFGSYWWVWGIVAPILVGMWFVPGWLWRSVSLILALLFLIWVF
jgi:hypothetical protein